MTDNPSKSFSYVTIGQMFATGFQAGFYLLFASLLDPESYGQLGYIIALAGIFSVVSRFGMNFTVTVYRAKGKSEIANQVNFLVLITSGVASLILLPINEVAAILCVALTFFTMNQHNLLGLKKYKRHALTAIVKSILLLSIPFALYLIMEIPGILIGMAISNFLGSLDYIKSLSKRFLSFRDIKKNYKVFVGNFGIDVSSTFPTIVDKLLIVPLFGFVSAGIYLFNIQILFALSVLPVILHGFLLSEESSGNSHKKIMYFSLGGSAILTIIAILLAPTVVNWFFPKFVEGIFGLQIMVLSLVPLTISSIFNAKLQSQESTKIGLAVVIRISSLLVFLAVLGNLYGLLGFAIAILISTILYTFSLYILYNKSKHHEISN